MIHDREAGVCYLKISEEWSRELAISWYKRKSNWTGPYMLRLSPDDDGLLEIVELEERVFYHVIPDKLPD